MIYRISSSLIYVIVDNMIHAVKKDISGMPLSKSFYHYGQNTNAVIPNKVSMNIYLAVYSYSCNYQQTNTKHCNGV